MIRILFLLLFLLAGPPLFAHEGHDHAATTATPASATRHSPRFAMRGDGIEIVGVLLAGELELYVDRSADNAPLADAEIEIEGALQGKLKTDAEGHAHLPAGMLAQAGQHALTLTVSAGDLSDLFAATLVVEAADEHAEPNQRRWLIVAALLAFAALAALAIWRRRTRQGAAL